jgi:hypothetical protein
VRQIPTDDASFGARGGGDGGVIEELAAVVVHTCEHYERDFVAIFIKQGFDVLGADR